MRLKKYFGPSTLVAAAFIGPGTVTTCTLAGVHSSYSLIWALLFSTVATVILQEMSARLGFISRKGLGEAVKKQFTHKVLKYLVFTLIISAIFVGNAAYEAGNLTGAALGFELILGPLKIWPLIIGLLCFALLITDKYGWIENFLISLVILMSICFLITAILSKPDMISLFRGMIPTMPGEEELILAMGLIGTTVVPYNLFLHASIISKKWKKQDKLSDIRIENAVSILLGGLISVLILIVAASTSGDLTEVNSAADLAIQIEPLLGSYAWFLMGFGLMAAGLSSSITAALAAAYVVKGLVGNGDTSSALYFRISWIIILLFGTVIALSGFNSILLIKFAQVTNALLLPIMAGFLLYACNSKTIMGKYINSFLQNIFGLLVILLSLALSVKTLIFIFLN